MSAFLVSHKHINVLLSYAANPQSGYGPMYCYLKDDTVLHFNDPAEIQQAAEILYTQNIRSIEARYPDTVGHPEDMPGTIAELGKSIVYQRPYELKTWKPVEIIKLCDCYDYQACETGDYKDTDAAHIVNAIRGRAIDKLPGYDEAPWSI